MTSARMPKLPIIGIVGGIGSGKSLVAAELARHGGRLISGDSLGHEALRQADIKAKVVERWGEGVVDEKGDIKRRALGRIVFADPRELRALETLVFPWIGRRLQEEIDKAEVDPELRMVVIDAAVMMEAGWDQKCDRVIFVDAPRELRLQRLVAQRNWSERELAEREKSQLPLQEKRSRADAVVNNGASPENLAEQVEGLLQRWGIGPSDDKTRMPKE